MSTIETMVSSIRGLTLLRQTERIRAAALMVQAEAKHTGTRQRADEQGRTLRIGTMYQIAESLETLADNLDLLEQAKAEAEAESGPEPEPELPVWEVSYTRDGRSITIQRVLASTAADALSKANKPSVETEHDGARVVRC